MWENKWKVHCVRYSLAIFRVVVEAGGRQMTWHENEFMLYLQVLGLKGRVW